MSHQPLSTYDSEESYFSTELINDLITIKNETKDHERDCLEALINYLKNFKPEIESWFFKQTQKKEYTYIYKHPKKIPNHKPEELSNDQERFLSYYQYLFRQKILSRNTYKFQEVLEKSNEFDEIDICPYVILEDQINKKYTGDFIEIGGYVRGVCVSVTGDGTLYYECRFTIK